jgi:parallel beta-helix repeat protein
MGKSNSLILILALFSTLANTGAAELPDVQAIIPIAPQIPQMSGRLEANGTHFELNNSDYLNITLDSSEPIKLVLESIPEMVTMQLESDSGATSTQMTLSNFLPLTTYHIYEDDYHNHSAFASDANGYYTYNQDLSKQHLVFIQPRPSTRFINNNATGGDCILIGTWNSATKTCTLTTDLSETIQIDSNGITLDGNGHTVTGSKTGNGVYLYGRTGVTIRNLNVRNFLYGIYLRSSSDNNIANNTVANNYWWGIVLDSSNGNTLTGNIANSNYAGVGIVLTSSSNNILTGNTANNDGSYGIYLISSSYNTLIDNTASNNQLGIYLYSSNHNNLTNNTANSNHGSYMYWWALGFYLYSSSYNNLQGNTANSNNNLGIYLAYSDTNILKGNIIASNVNHGIGISASINNNLIDNVASSNGYSGFYIAANSNSLANNTAKYSQHGIVLASSSTSNNLARNIATNNRIGILVYYASYNTLTENNASYNSAGYDTFGIKMDGSNYNTLVKNTLLSNVVGVGIVSSSNNNKVYNNNFLNNPAQAYVSGGSGNVFNLALPTGGNYWSNWNSPDNNDDGFVDSPYVFSGGQDNLPWAANNGWLDKTPPITTASLSGTIGNNGWYKSNVQVTLAAVDDGVGVKKTEYGFDGINWNIYSTPVVINNEGTTTVYYRSTDNVGNVESTKNQTIKIDKTPPSIIISGVINGSYYDSSVTPVVVITDANLNSTLIALDGAPFISGAVVSAEGSYTLVASATDVAGNSNLKTVNFVIDKTPPEAIIKFNTTSKDIKVYNNKTGGEASYVVLPSTNEQEEGDENSWELRQYTLKDLANNSLVLVLKHKKEGKEAEVKVISTQYNGGAVIVSEKNKMQAEYSEEKNGALKELEQMIEVKKLFEVEAKYSSKKNTTEIKAKLEGQKEQSQSMAGIVILELLTDKSGLKYRY